MAFPSSAFRCCCANVRDVRGLDGFDIMSSTITLTSRDSAQEITFKATRFMLHGKLLRPFSMPFALWSTYFYRSHVILMSFGKEHRYCCGISFPYTHFPVCVVAFRLTKPCLLQSLFCLSSVIFVLICSHQLEQTNTTFLSYKSYALRKIPHIQKARGTVYVAQLCVHLFSFLSGVSELLTVYLTMW